jgi:hypothetical protein
MFARFDIHTCRIHLNELERLHVCMGGITPTAFDMVGRRYQPQFAPPVAINARVNDCHSWSRRITPKSIAACAYYMRVRGQFGHKNHSQNQGTTHA